MGSRRLAAAALVTLGVPLACTLTTSFDGLTGGAVVDAASDAVGDGPLRYCEGPTGSLADATARVLHCDDFDDSTRLDDYAVVAPIGNVVAGPERSSSPPNALHVTQNRGSSGPSCQLAALQKRTLPAPLGNETAFGGEVKIFLEDAPATNGEGLVVTLAAPGGEQCNFTLDFDEVGGRFLAAVVVDGGVTAVERIPLGNGISRGRWVPVAYALGGTPTAVEVFVTIDGALVLSRTLSIALPCNIRRDPIAFSLGTLCLDADASVPTVRLSIDDVKLVTFY